jgi:hypothetical protein
MSRTPHLIGFAAGVAAALGTAAAEDAAILNAGRKLVAAYPDQLARIEGAELVWRDGTRMALHDGRSDKPYALWLAEPSLADMVRFAYPAGAAPAPPERDVDPGRARNVAFFDKMYGTCRDGGVAARLVDVVWLPKKAGQRLKVTAVNGVAEKLRAVSLALDALPAAFDVFLTPSAGTYNCRPIAGTSRMSAHGYGIAIDIALGQADYWRWQPPARDGRPVWRNRIPREIVDIFEAHGFIWGGRWHHYDTMHFEYRPELLPERPAAAKPAP